MCGSLPLVSVMKLGGPLTVGPDSSSFCWFIFYIIVGFGDAHHSLTKNIAPLVLTSAATVATLWNLTVTAIARLDLWLSLAAPLCHVTCVPSSNPNPGAMQLDVRFATIAEMEQRHFLLARYDKNV